MTIEIKKLAAQWFRHPKQNLGLVVHSYDSEGRELTIGHPSDVDVDTSQVRNQKQNARRALCAARLAGAKFFLAFYLPYCRLLLGAFSLSRLKLQAAWLESLLKSLLIAIAPRVSEGRPANT